MSDTFRCPACAERLAPRDLPVHLAERPDERREAFVLFVGDDEADPSRDASCTGAREILPLIDEAEQQRFGIERPSCGETVVSCACGGTYCAEHTSSCTICGRFTCLRHRWSGKCPVCARGVQARPVRVEKYDPFSKQRSTFVRKYRRSGRTEPWSRLVDDDSSG